MSRLRVRLAALCTAFLCIYIGAGAQTVDTWGGGFPDDKINVATNWIGGVLPSGYMSGTDTLTFTGASDSNLNLNVAGISFAGIQINDALGNDLSVNVYGSNSLVLKGGGIAFTSNYDGQESAYISVPLTLVGDQIWTPGYYGFIQVSGALSGNNNLILQGSALNGSVFEFDASSSTFSGNVTVKANTTVLQIGASGPFGSAGTITLGDGTSLDATTGSLITLANPMVFGDSSAGYSVILGSTQSADFPITAQLKFTGNAIFNVNGSDSSDSEVDLNPNTTVTFAGNLDGGTAGVCLDFGSTGTGVNSLAIIQGTFGSNISRFDLEDNISVILDGNPATQISNLADIGTSSGTYLGFGASYIGSLGGVTGLLASSKIGLAGFQGTLGFDTTSGVTSNFTDNVDLSSISTDLNLSVWDPRPGRSFQAQSRPRAASRPCRRPTPLAGEEEHSLLPARSWMGPSKARSATA